LIPNLNWSTFVLFIPRSAVEKKTSTSEQQLIPTVRFIFIPLIQLWNSSVGSAPYAGYLILSSSAVSGSCHAKVSDQALQGGFEMSIFSYSSFSVRAQR